jgi:hypothetical protein
MMMMMMMTICVAAPYSTYRNLSQPAEHLRRPAGHTHLPHVSVQSRQCLAPQSRAEHRLQYTINACSTTAKNETTVRFQEFGRSK